MCRKCTDEQSRVLEIPVLGTSSLAPRRLARKYRVRQPLPGTIAVSPAIPMKHKNAKDVTHKKERKKRNRYAWKRKNKKTQKICMNKREKKNPQSMLCMKKKNEMRKEIYSCHCDMYFARHCDTWHARLTIYHPYHSETKVHRSFSAKR